MEAGIIEGSYNDYLMLFGDDRTRQTDLSAKMAAESGKLYLLLAEGSPGGFLTLIPDVEADRIDFVYVVPEKRGQGHCRRLMEHALARAAGDVWLSVGEKVLPLRHLAGVLGFWLNSKSITFRSGEERDMSHWQKYMEEKGHDLNRVLERMGFFAYSFREAAPELLDRLYHSAENEYANPMDVRPFFDLAGKCLDRDLSFLAVQRKEGREELAAYNLVCRPDERSAVFEQMSAAARFWHTGCVFLPISRSMQAFQDMGLNRAAYTMYEGNDRANALRRKIFDRVTVFSQRTYHYIWKGKSA